jgi:hypothetical protein
MGLHVNSGVLPNGVQVDDVYMSFRNEVVYITVGGGNKNGETTQWNINTHYRVFKDPSKTNSSDIRVPFCVFAKDITRPVYAILYEQLECIYPDSNIIV